MSGAAAGKLRAQGSACGTLHVFITTKPFRTRAAQHADEVTVPLPEPTDDNRVLAGWAIAGLRKVFKPGHSTRRRAQC